MKKILLWVLNRIDGGKSPIRPSYGRIDNINLFQKSFLIESGDMEPEITLRRFMWEMEQMSKCTGKKDEGLKVFEGGEMRDATPRDVYDATHL